jgi:uncharacterized protein
LAHTCWAGTPVGFPDAAPASRRRVKIWGEARVVENHADLTARLMPEGLQARSEQVILFTVPAWNANYPQHTPQRFEAADVAAALSERDQRIAALEAEVGPLREVAAEGVSSEIEERYL